MKNKQLKKCLSYKFLMKVIYILHYCHDFVRNKDKVSRRL